MQKIISSPVFNSVLYFGRKNCIYSNKIKTFLKRHSRKFQYIESKNISTKLFSTEIKLDQYDYIFCFRSFFVFKKNILNRCKKAAINFHPGTPEYREIGCINYALYNEAKYYGSTAYIMDEKIDNGKILNVKRFKIGKKENIESCSIKTNRLMFKQATHIIKLLLKNEKNLQKLINSANKEKWSKKIKVRTKLDEFYRVSTNISKRNFLKKLRATKTQNFKPYILLHSKKFELKD